MTTIFLDSPDQLQDVYDDLGADFEAVDYTEILGGLIDDLQDQHRDMFNAEKDSTGAPWAPLKPATIKKKGHSIRLVEKGDLKESLAFGSADSIREVFREEGVGITAAVFGTSDEKAHRHQFGTARMPARPPVGITDELIDDLTENTADETVRQLIDV